MPRISCPDLLGLKPVHELTEDGLDTIPFARKHTRPGLFFMFSGAEWCQECQILFPQTIHQDGFPIVAVSKELTSDAREHHFGCNGVVNISRQEFQVTDDARPRDASMDAQAKAFLSGDFIVAIGGNLLQTSAAIGSSKATDGQWHTIHDVIRSVILNPLQQLTPELHLDGPQIGRLTDERGPMDALQTRKPAAVMSLEVEKDRLVGSQAQPDTYHFDC